MANPSAPTLTRFMITEARTNEQGNDSKWTKCKRNFKALVLVAVFATVYG